MLNHVVLITLKEGVTEAQVTATLDGLAALAGVIPEIRSYDFGRDAGLSPNSVDMALVARFDSVEDFAAYREHPAHKAFARDLLLPIAESFATIQFDSQD